MKPTQSIPQRLTIFLVVFFVVWTLRVILLSTFLNPPHPTFWLEMAGIALKWMLWVLPVIVLVRLEHSNPMTFLRLSSRVGQGILTGFVVGLIYALGIVLVGHVVHNSSLNFAALLNVPLVLISAALPEELLFRGYVMAHLETFLPFWEANLVCALLFLASHFAGWTFYGLWSVQNTIVVFVVGLICGVLVRRTNSIWSGVVFHTLNNLVALI